MKILGFIPARGGSKGLLQKNILQLAGKPLIAHTILTAKKSKMFDKIIVSTDSKTISDISKKYGAESPVLRPKKISGDQSNLVEAINFTLNFLEKNASYSPDIIVILQPTSPLRSTDIIKKSIRLLKKTNSSSVISVSKVKTHPFISFWCKNGFLEPFKQNFTDYSNRQKLTPLYSPTGDVYTFWRSNLNKSKYIYGSRIKPIIITNEIHIDIDNIFDLFMTEMVIKYWKKYMKIK